MAKGPSLRVKHDLQDVVEAQDAILVLQDSTIEESEEKGDELINLDLLAMEKGNKNIELRKKRIGYNPMEHAEKIQRGEKSSLLSQYDEADEEAQGFVIQVGSTVNVNKKKKPPTEDISAAMKANAVTLDYEKTKEVADYYTQEEVISFKKKKSKKKSKNLRKGAFDFAADDQDGDGDTKMKELAQSNRDTDISTVNFVDDDDLQKALARSRKLATKSHVILKTEDIADMARHQDASYMDQDENVGLVISDTSEFVRNLDVTSALSRESNSLSRPNDVTQAVTLSNPQSSMPHEEDEVIQKVESGVSVSQSAEVPMEEEKDEWGLEETQQELTETNANELDLVDDDLLAKGGLAAMLTILQRKGELDQATEDDVKRDQKQREKLEWLSEQRKRDAIEAVEASRRKKHKGDRKREDDWEYERERAREDRERIRETLDRFKDYKPEVKIVHKDEFGRELNEKQAYKQLARQFHGMQPKKNKTEKELRKIAEEMKMKQMSSNDTPLNSATALAERTKELGTAYIPLSVGNRGVLPSDLPKATTAKAASKATKGKTAESTAIANVSTISAAIISAPAIQTLSAPSPFMTLPAPSATVNTSSEGLSGRGKVTFGLSGGLKLKSSNALADPSKKRKELE